MTHRLSKSCLTAAAALAVAMLILGNTGELMARGSSSSGGSRGGGGGFHSSGGSRSSGSSSSWGSSGRSSSSSSGSSKSSGWGSSGRFGSSSSSGSATPSSSTPSSTWASKLSPADRALADKAKASGTLFTSRDAAVKDFRNKYAPTYTSSFPTEPSVRPSYIPQQYNVNGQTVPISYNPAYGSYGYMYGGRWTVFDALATAAVADTLMHNHSYYYSPMAASNSYHAAAGSFSCCTLVFVLFLIVLVAVVVVKLISAASRRAAPPIRTSPPPKAAWDMPKGDDGKPDGFPDTQSADSWRRVNLGTIITLGDELAMKDSQEKTGQAQPISYTVTDIRRIRESRGLADWLLLHVKGTYPEFADQKLWILVKTVDREMNLNVYEELKDVAPGDRRDFVDRDERWLFQAPVDPDNINYDSLLYTMEIVRQVEGNDVTFSLKPQGELHGTCSQEPAPSGMTAPLLATVAEYMTDASVDNPELLVLEIGAHDSPTGGAITIMEGGPINPAEVEIL